MCKKKEEVKEFTTELVEINDNWMKAQAYKEACEKSIFVRRKTITNAILAEKLIREEFWKAVKLTWPYFRKATAQIFAGGYIKFTWDE